MSPGRAWSAALGFAGLCGGFVVWSAAFVALYGGLSIGCRFGWDQIRLGPLDANRSALIVIWLAFVLAAAALLALLGRRDAGPTRRDRFLHRAAMLSSAAALVATVWTGLPILGTSTCV